MRPEQEERAVEETRLQAQVNDIVRTIELIKDKLSPVMRNSTPEKDSDVVYETDLERMLAYIQYNLSDIQNRVRI